MTSTVTMTPAEIQAVAERAALAAVKAADAARTAKPLLAVVAGICAEIEAGPIIRTKTVERSADQIDGMVERESWLNLGLLSQRAEDAFARLNDLTLPELEWAGFLDSLMRYAKAIGPYAEANYRATVMKRAEAARAALLAYGITNPLW